MVVKICDSNHTVVNSTIGIKKCKAHALHRPAE